MEVKPKRTTKSLAALATSLAVGLILSACGEATVDPTRFGVAPDLAPRFGPADTTDRTAEADEGDLVYAHDYTNEDDEFFTVQFEGSIDESKSSADWNIDSARQVVEDFIETTVNTADPVDFESAPDQVRAYEKGVRLDNGNVIDVYAQAWERGRCAVLAITNVPRGQAAPLLAEVDRRVIEACGS